MGDFSKKLKKLRLEKGISQQKLADMIFVSRSAVTKWENGLGLLSAESYEALATIFEVPIDFFRTEDPEKIIIEKNKKIKKISHLIRIAIAVIVFFFWFLNIQQSSNTAVGLDALDTRIELEFSFSKSGIAQYLTEYEYSASLSDSITKFRMASLYGYYLDGQVGGDPQWLILAEQLREISNPDVFKYLSHE
ncbi:MAG: helix-turn-helix domain-containing protein [Lawsonibacter sp.]|jgi:transcriptional regulator with XRE-family HTH domain